MAASIERFLSSELETLRHDVLKAGVLNAKALRESTECHLAKFGSALPPSPALDDALFQIVTSVSAFARLLYGQAQIAESEAARRQTLATIERLAQLVGSVEPTGPSAAGPSGEVVS